MTLHCALHDFGLLAASAPEGDPAGTLVVAGIAVAVVLVTAALFVMVDDAHQAVEDSTRSTQAGTTTLAGPWTGNIAQP